jgi:general secretion pathway protein J
VRNKGFTLLELLVALALLTILATALYGTYFAVIRGRESAVARIETRRELSTTLDMLRREITATCYHQTTNEKNRYRFVVEDRDIFGKPASTLELTTFSPPGDGARPTSDVAQVTYSILEKEGKMTLVRQDKDVYLETKGPSYPQVTEVAGFLVECYDGNKWVKSWNMALNTGLPKLVRITLGIMEGDKPVEYTTIAAPRVSGT